MDILLVALIVVIQLAINARIKPKEFAPTVTLI